MPFNVPLAGTNFPLPSQSERNWAAQVNAFFIALGQKTLQNAGGSFTLTAEADFGPNFGVLFSYIKSKTSGTLPGSGWLRLAKTDRIVLKNILDNADIPIGLSQSSGRLQSGSLCYFSAVDTTDIFSTRNASTLQAGRLPSVGETVQIQAFTGTGITFGATYYVTDIVGDTFKLYTAQGGPTYLDVTAAGTGIMIIMDDVVTAASIDILKNKTMNDLSLSSETGTITAGAITPATGKAVQRITTSSATFLEVGLPQDGKLYVFINETAADVTIKHNSGTALKSIFTPGGIDFTWKKNSAVNLLYDAGITAWVISGGGAGGGLTPASVSSSATAQPGIHYLTNTSSAAFTLTLPAGATGAVMRFSDAGGTWDSKNLTITPSTGQNFQGLAANDSIVCNVKNSWLEISWSGTNWSWNGPGFASQIPSTGNYIPGVQDGTVPLGGLPGATNGVAPGAGKLGEKITWTSAPGSQAATTTEADWTNAFITLTPGVWLVQASIMTVYTTGAVASNAGYTLVRITDSANNIVQEMDKLLYCKTVAAVSNISEAPLAFSFVANFSTTTTYKIRFYRADTPGPGSGSLENSSIQRSQFYGVRIG